MVQVFNAIRAILTYCHVKKKLSTHVHIRGSKKPITNKRKLYQWIIDQQLSSKLSPAVLFDQVFIRNITYVTSINNSYCWIR